MDPRTDQDQQEPSRRSPSGRWVFGYGSLVWRPSFPFLERCPACLDGWARRFWQGSTDHRGVPGSPGRVVTLVEEVGARCWGMAYRVRDIDYPQVLATLDHREQGGYERRDVELSLRRPTGIKRARSLVYLATRANPNYLGPATLREVAEQVQRSHGPSGSNVEYVLRLDRALRELGVEDPEVAELARFLDGTPDFR